MNCWRACGRLLRRGPALRPETVEIADLSIDTRARRVRRGGRQIELTAKEYALLEYLARRAGEVVSRAEIAEHVWEEELRSVLQSDRGLHAAVAAQNR